ncbi:hypothetical protein ElyMa_006821000 [Elysia marginata]|uniref:Uncharacterized protein n=1 Tax=Elysia marginata TaxID=1093978 RepID=A0AAV4J3P2_9GAST|nr:hypothetical protein ElyMa_006821000 [Elysia marginata]
MSKCCLYLAALFVLLNDVADFVTDWLFFADVNKMKAGLVYGPPESSVWWAILIFNIVGSVLFLMETINLYYETKHENGLVDSDILSLVVVWLEDIPQVIISLYLVLCREEAISVFQLAKAIVILLGTFIRLIQVGVKYFSGKAKKSKHHRKIKIAIFIGMFIQFVCAGCVFGLAYTAPDDTGIFFKVPTTIVDEKVDEAKYFANVSVFVNHAELFDDGGLRIAENGNMEREVHAVNWMRLESIKTIMVEGKGGGVHYNVQYEANPSSGILKLAWWKKTGLTHPTWVTLGCYVVNQTTGTVSKVSTPITCTKSYGFFTEYSKNVYVAFGYTPPGKVFKGQIFGDITVNMRLDSIEGGYRDCRKVEKHTSSLKTHANTATPLRFQYFQTSSNIAPVAHFLSDTSNSPQNLRFFRNDGKDLIHIKNVWKTGWMSCESEGNLSPTLNEHLKVTCSRSE